MPVLGTSSGATKGPATAPTIGTATAGNGTASVTFSAPSFSKLPITQYTVTSSSGLSNTGASSPIVITETVAGTRTYTVTATNGNATSAASSASNSLVFSAPAAPTIGSVTRTNNTTVSVPFTAGSTGNATITSYTITSSPSIALSYSGTSSPFTVTGTFVQGTSYTFSMTATNKFGTSTASSASNSVTPYPQPVLGSWSSSTAYPISAYNSTNGAGGTTSTSQVYVGNGFAADSYQPDAYSWNGSSWGSLVSTASNGRSGMCRIDATRVAMYGGVATYGYYYENRVQTISGSTVTDDTRTPIATTLSAVASVNGGIIFVGGQGNTDFARYYRNTVVSGAYTLGTNYPISTAYAMYGSDTKDFTKGLILSAYAANGYTFTSVSGAFTAATNKPVADGGELTLAVINNQTLFFKPNISGSAASYLTDGTTYTLTTAIPSTDSLWHGGAVGANMSLVRSGVHYRATLS